MTQAQPEPHKYRYPPAIWRKALRIADRLGETTLSARFQIAAILQLCGRDFVHQMLEQTREVEALGGMLVHDGSRRRTPGGVFFYLAISAMTEEQRQKLFSRRSRFRWTDRRHILQPLLAEPGRVQTAQVTLIGRPEEVWTDDEVVVLRMPHLGVFTPTPRGVPQPQSHLLNSCYTVFIQPDHWGSQVEALEAEQQALVVEGRCVYDPALEGLAVYALKVSTTRLKKKKSHRT